MKLNIRTKLTLSILCLLIVPLVTLSVISYEKSSETLTTTYQNSLTEVNKGISDTISNFFESYKLGLIQTSLNDNVKVANTLEENDQWLMNVLESYVNTYDQTTQVYIGLKDGSFMIYPHAKMASDYDPRTRPWYTGAMDNNGFFWSDIYTDAVSGKQAISGSIPIYDRNNRAIGVLGTTIDLEGIADTVANVTIGDTGYVSAVNPEGITIAHPNKDVIGVQVPVPEILTAISTQDQGIVHYEYSGSNKFAIFQKVDDLNWYVMSTLSESEITDKTSSIFVVSVILLIASIAIAGAIGIILATSFTKPIKAIVEDMTKVSSGDLTVVSEIKSKDEIGLLSDSFNQMVSNMRNLLTNTIAVSNDVSIAAENLAAGSEEASASSAEVNRAVEEIANGATEQAQEAETSVILATDLEDKFNTLIANSTDMEGNAAKVIENNKIGAGSLEDLHNKSIENNESANRIEDAIIQLEQKSNEISGITETISSIADQTNLLALNASIEAARAGEHGKGFAVVADEIRKLSESSSQSADDIRIIINIIQQMTKNTVAIMSEFKTNSQAQDQAVTDVNVSFGEISKSIDLISESIMSTHDFINEMVLSKNKIIDSISSISSVSEETAASSEEVSATMDQLTETVETVAVSASTLNELSIQLNDEISKFNI